MLLLVSFNLSGCFNNSSNINIVGNYYVTSININGFENMYTQNRVMSFDDENNYYAYSLDGSWSISDSGTYIMDEDVLTVTNDESAVNSFTVSKEGDLITLTLTESDSELLTVYITVLQKINGESPVLFD